MIRGMLTVQNNYKTLLSEKDTDIDKVRDHEYKK